MALGLLAAIAATPRGERSSAGAKGAAILACAVFYYGFFDFWCTAQCELWASLAVVAGLAAVRKASTARRAALLAGFACGAALLLKPPAAPLVLVVVGVLAVRVARERREVRARAASFAWFAGAAGLLPAVTLAYFAARGGLAAMADVLLGANAYYVAHEPPGFGLAFALGRLHEAWRFFAPFDTLVVVALAAGGAWAWLGRRATGRAYATTAALVAATVAATVLQRKFYLYHWTLGTTAIGLLAAVVFRDLTGADGRSRPQRDAVAGLALAAAVIAFHASSGGPFDVWARTTKATLSWAAGRTDRAGRVEALSKIARFYGHRYDYADREHAGVWLRDHTTPDDPILVRGMAAEIYVVADRRAPGRFFWSLFLTLPSRAYRREEWLREDLAAIEERPPRFVVVYADAGEGPESASWFASLGYRPCQRFGGLVILAGPTAAPPLARAGSALPGAACRL